MKYVSDDIFEKVEQKTSNYEGYELKKDQMTVIAQDYIKDFITNSTKDYEGCLIQMTIKDRIDTLTQSYTLKFLKVNIVKMQMLTNDLKRYCKQECGKLHSAQFTSQDLRSFTCYVEKMLKKVNKQLSFVTEQKELLENEKVTNEVFIKYAHSVGEYARIAVDLQVMLTQLNWLCCFMYLVELQVEQMKQKDEKILQQELEFIALEILR